MGYFKTLDIESHNDIHDMAKGIELIVGFLDTYLKKYGPSFIDGAVFSGRIYLDIGKAEYIEKKGNKIIIKLK